MSPSLPLPSFHTFCVVRRGRTTARDGLEVRQYGPGRYRTGQRLRSCMAKTSLETNCCNPDPAEKCLSHCARLTRHVLNSDKAVATLIQLREKQEGLHASQGLDIITKLPAESGHYSSPQMTASPTVPAAEVLKIQGGCLGVPWPLLCWDWRHMRPPCRRVSRNSLPGKHYRASFAATFGKRANIKEKR